MNNKEINDLLEAWRSVADRGATKAQPVEEGRGVANAYQQMWAEAAVKKEEDGKKANKKVTSKAVDSEEIHDKESKSGNRFIDLHTDNVDEDDTEEKGHKDVSVAGRAGPKQSPARGAADNLSNGDSKVAPTVKGVKKND